MCIPPYKYDPYKEFQLFFKDGQESYLVGTGKRFNPTIKWGEHFEILGIVNPYPGEDSETVLYCLQNYLIDLSAGRGIKELIIGDRFARGILQLPFKVLIPIHS